MKLVKENINETIKHLSGRDNQEILDKFLDISLEYGDSVYENFHKLMSFFEKEYGITSMIRSGFRDQYYNRNEEDYNKITDKLMELFREFMKEYQG